MGIFITRPFRGTLVIHIDIKSKRAQSRLLFFVICMSFSVLRVSAYDSLVGRCNRALARHPVYFEANCSFFVHFGSFFLLHVVRTKGNRCYLELSQLRVRVTSITLSAPSGRGTLVMGFSTWASFNGPMNSAFGPHNCPLSSGARVVKDQDAQLEVEREVTTLREVGFLCRPGHTSILYQKIEQRVALSEVIISWDTQRESISRGVRDSKGHPRSRPNIKSIWRGFI